ncbi:hypothetical protein [Halarsenatibacter silvermanii]|uniref:Uncharacterized protein n=1 Tax=Halarsenatibacter silvermanii TaxID=321763 RepID=A0A1G9HD32_9FIRM|nr:hypothetical protein [Halarsenatibacter silvermanii]SDL10931.1 hypothetical protein SAMN04488692_101181 [Halarsenatibacter silvermanii]
MVGVSGLLVIGLIFYLILRFGFDEDFGYSFLSDEDGQESSPHPLGDKFSGSLSDDELMKLARKQLENGDITESELESFVNELEESHNCGKES